MKSLVPALALILLCGLPLAAEDRIIFIDDNVLDAVVIAYNPTSGSVTLAVSKGTITIPAYRIRKVDYDTTIMRPLSDNPAKCADLAEFMAGHEAYEAAIDVLNRVAGMPGAPKDLEKRLGALYESTGNHRRAIESLRNFVEKYPGDLSAHSKIDELMKKLKTSGEKVDEGAPVIEVVRPQVDEGHEQGGWRVQAWGNPGSVQYISLGLKADRLLKVDFTKKDKDKVAIQKQLSQEESDLTKTPICTFDIYNNTSTPLKVSMAVVTSPGWAFYESRQLDVAPRNWEQGITIDLRADDFKSAATGWQHSSSIKNLDRTVQIIFMLYETEVQGVVFFNNIRFEEAPPVL